MSRGRDRDGGRRGRRTLTPEERELWSRVAVTARAARRDAQRSASPPPTSAISDGDERRTEASPAAEASAAIDAATRILRPGGSTKAVVSWSPQRGDDRPGPVGRGVPGLDAGTARRLGRGRIEPQARLDLHGMTADRAHAALSGFVAGATAQGLRCVLVVTGMGRGEGGRGEGVLRRETPRWLSVAPLAANVVGVFQAHPRHGGAGALYVYLKRRR